MRKYNNHGSNQTISDVVINLKTSHTACHCLSRSPLFSTTTSIISWWVLGIVAVYPHFGATSTPLSVNISKVHLVVCQEKERERGRESEEDISTWLVQNEIFCLRWELYNRGNTFQKPSQSFPLIWPCQRPWGSRLSNLTFSCFPFNVGEMSVHMYSV